MTCVEEKESYCSEKCQVATEQNQSSDDCNDESCSPFCTCACCGSAAFFVSILINTISLPVPNSTMQTSLYKSDFFNAYFSTIWQPPKIS